MLRTRGLRNLIYTAELRKFADIGSSQCIQPAYEDVMDLARKLLMNGRGAAALNAPWLFSMVWLVLAAAGLIYDFAWWLMNPNDSRRYETVISSGIVLLISVPALLIVMLFGLLPRTGMSGCKRTNGIALALFCIGIFLLHSYLQGKPH